MLKVVCIVVGTLWTNSYIIWDTDTGQGILVDPGDDGKELLREIERNKIKIKGIILTHGHFDHVKDAKYVSSILNAPVMASEKEIPVIEHVSKQSIMFGFAPVQAPKVSVYLNEHDKINVGAYEFVVLNTPGHSPGSITLYNNLEGIAIVGDLIFLESIGRTDLPGGDYETLIKSIREKILTMPDNTRILSGHGEQTTVGHERLNNPFLTGEYRYEA